MRRTENHCPGRQKTGVPPVFHFPNPHDGCLKLTDVGTQIVTLQEKFRGTGFCFKHMGIDWMHNVTKKGYTLDELAMKCNLTRKSNWPT